MSFIYILIYSLVNGGYTDWTGWSDCSTSCGGGERLRTRKCTEPVPKYGGNNCASLGPGQLTEKCNTNACPGTFAFERKLMCVQ